MLNYLRGLRIRSKRNVAAALSASALCGVSQMGSRQQDDLLQFVLDSMAEAVIVCDRDLRMAQFNRGASAIFGADLRGDSFRSLADKHQLLPAPGAPSIPAEARPLARALKGEVTNNAQFILRRPGM